MRFRLNTDSYSVGHDAALNSFVIANAANTLTNRRLVIDNNGNVGIGTTSPGTLLSIQGVGNFASTGSTITSSVTFTGLAAGAAGDNDVCIGATSKILTDAAASTCIVSSKKYKENIKPLTYSLDKIMQLNPISFTYKPNLDGSRIKGIEHIGLIAEEVLKIEPRLVQFEADGITPRTVSYEESVALLVGAIKEQQQQINELRAEIKKLKK